MPPIRRKLQNYDVVLALLNNVTNRQVETIGSWAQMKRVAEPCAII